MSRPLETDEGRSWLFKRPAHYTVGKRNIMYHDARAFWATVWYLTIIPNKNKWFTDNFIFTSS